jgi:hypothetical protein
LLGRGWVGLPEKPDLPTNPLVYFPAQN